MQLLRRVGKTLCWAVFLLAGAPCRAQQVVAPTPETVGAPRGSTWDDYNITNSFETGYRFENVTGNQNEYRSSVNFGNGIRLLSGSLALNSKDGHGGLFDQAVLTTRGLGGDPYQAATFRIEKNRWYQYDLLWRQNDYFNPGLVTDGASGAHLLDTTYASQDHDLTILPGTNVQFFLGYSHDGQSGAGITTVPGFDPTTTFPVFSNVRRTRNEYRVGNQVRYHGLTLNWTHGWEDFKDDTGYQFTGTSAPIPPGGAELLSFLRTEPTHGTNPYWRVGLLFDRHFFNVNGRFTYSAGRHAYLLDESAQGVVGAGPVGAAANRQVASFGDAQRPVASGNLTVTLLPSDRLTIVNATSTYNVRTEGNSVYAQVDNATQSANFAFFDYLGIFTVANQTDFNYRVRPWLGFYGGYHYSQRRIRSVQDLLSPAGAPTVYDQTNRLNSGVFGIRLSALKTLTISADGEIGRNSLPFAPKSDGAYHDITGRVRYKWRKLDLTAWSHADYNVNAVSLSAYSSHARTYAASASWTPVTWFGLDASYSKMHLDTIGGIAYFAGLQSVQGEQSYYVSNIHSANLGARFELKKVASLYFGYSIVQDTGDERADLLGNNVASSLPAFQSAQTFPMRFQSPIARLSFRLAEKVRLNVGYQYYGYREDFFGTRDYRANTGYTSLLWSF
jgi:hypothetical protein